MYVSKKRDLVSLSKILAEILCIASALFCSLYLLCVLSVMAVLRQLIFHFRGKKAWAESKFWLYFFLAFTLVSPIVEFTIDGWDNVTTNQLLLASLPTIGSIFNTIGYYVKRTLTAKLLLTPAVILYGVYAIIVSYIPKVIGFGLSVISLIIGFVNEYLLYKHTKVSAILEQEKKQDD